MANTTDALTPFTDRLGAAWLSWQTRPMLRWVALGGATFLLFALTPLLAPQHAIRPENRPPAMPMLVAPFVLAVLTSLQTKTNFVTPAARLVPGYRSAHLGVTVISWSIVVLATPLLLAPVWDASPLGMGAAAIVLSATSAWANHIPALGFVPMCLMFACVNPTVNAFVHDPNLEIWPLRLVVLGLGWAAWVGWLRTLWDLNEERSDYVIPPIAAAFRRPTRAERGEQRKILARSFQKGLNVAQLGDAPLDRTLRTSKPLSLNKLTRAGLSALPSWLKSVTFAGVMGAIVYVMGAVLWTGRQLNNPIGILVVPMVFAMFIPATMASGLLDQKRPQMELELLRPIRRRDYYRTLLRELLRDQGMSMVAMLSVLAVAAAGYKPEILRADTVSAVALYIVGANLLVFAAAFWVTPHHSCFFKLFIIMAVAYAAMGGFGYLWWVGENDRLAPIGLAGVALGLVGAVVLRSAYRRWLIAEVG